MNRLPLILPLALALVACSQEPSTSTPPTPAAELASSTPAQPESEQGLRAQLSSAEQGSVDDERLRITVADEIHAYPALAAVVLAAAGNHRREMTAYASEIAADPEAGEWAQRWSLEVDYAAPVGNGGLRLVTGEGHAYTGGAHGLPIIERYTYLVDADRVLNLEDWFDDDQVWTALSEHSRRDLSEQAEAVHATYGGDPEERGFWVEMIEGGTEPSPGSFSIYEPILDDAGAVTGLRLIFPPYQVASYAEGTKYVEVPNQVFRRWLQPDLAALLAD